MSASRIRSYDWFRPPSVFTSAAKCSFDTRDKETAEVDAVSTLPKGGAVPTLLQSRAASNGSLCFWKVRKYRVAALLFSGFRWSPSILFSPGLNVLSLAVLFVVRSKRRTLIVRKYPPGLLLLVDIHGSYGGLLAIWVECSSNDFQSC